LLRGSRDPVLIHDYLLLSQKACVTNTFRRAVKRADHPEGQAAPQPAAQGARDYQPRRQPLS
jgi:hypothetical protein